MAGIYIHIPFCKQACYYCNFHFSTNLKLKTDLINSICKELKENNTFFESEEVYTIYIGGGTPSLLDAHDLEKIFNTIYKNFKISRPEITIEVNPDDLSRDQCRTLKMFGNRLSIGIQSFNENHLSYLNRAHSLKQSLEGFEYSRQAGFDNISLDLIYGIPHESHDIWINDLKTAIELSPEHMSCYCLTIEPKTVFGHRLEKKMMNSPDEDYGAEQFEIMLEMLEKADFEQYEISNFCRNDKYSKHNSSYWKDEKYLGVGPGAHSYDKLSRRINISNNYKYIDLLNKKLPYFEIEHLSQTDKINEYLLTSLRTKWGCDISKLVELGYEKYKLDAFLHKQKESNLLITEADRIILTKEGKLLADKMIYDLFLFE